MLYKIFLKIAICLKTLIINMLLLLILFLCNEPAFSKISKIESNLALKYCDSKDKNLFKGLDNEKILKYEYFFNSINKNDLNDKDKIIKNLELEIKNICSYNLNSKDKEDISVLLKNFLLKK
tara:strand:+ start:297 stop:662 length:366 start_codon:yes stop_codon:yes gene_type:complete